VTVTIIKALTLQPTVHAVIFTGGALCGLCLTNHVCWV